MDDDDVSGDDSRLSLLSLGLDWMGDAVDPSFLAAITNILIVPLTLHLDYTL